MRTENPVRSIQPVGLFDVKLIATYSVEKTNYRSIPGEFRLYPRDLFRVILLRDSQDPQ